jgi:DNA-binding NarL/FixJ family response regulator
MATTPPDVPGLARLCLVDDHALLREQLTLLLHHAGYEVVAAVGTCEEGYHAITNLAPDAAVIDHQLPDGWGVDLCRRVAVDTPAVRLVIHTGMVGPGLEVAALDAGAAAVVPKTVRGTDLLVALATLLGPGAEPGPAS